MSNRTRKSAPVKGVSKRSRKAKTTPTATPKLPAPAVSTPVPQAPTAAPAQPLPVTDDGHTPIRPRKRGRPSNAEKAARQAAAQAAPAGSNGDHPKTLPAVAASPRGYLLKIGDWAREVTSIEQAQEFFVERANEIAARDGDKAMPMLDGEVFGPAGTKVARIDQMARAFALNGQQIGNLRSFPKAEEPVAEELEPATSVPVAVKYLAAALAIAPKKDTRYYLNAVYLQQAGDQMRIVATDGHRLLVVSVKQDKPLPWGEDGLLIPREELERIVKFVGKTNARGEGAVLDISYGRKHPVIRVQEPGGMATFTVTPVDGKFPDYMKVVASAGDALAAERAPMETSAVQAAYLKSAGAIAAQLESDSVFSFVGNTDAAPCVFTFGGEPGALLYISAYKAGVQAVQTPAVQLLGESGMARTLAALKAHETRNREAAKACTNQKEAESLVAKANVFAERANEIRAQLSVKLTGPTTDKKAAQEEAAAEA